MSERCRLCCKSLFALLIEISSSLGRACRVKMSGTSSPSDKLIGDFGNEIEAISISDLDLLCLLAGKLSLFNFELLQHGVIPGSSQTKARESALQERMRPSSCGLAAMESGNGILCRTGRVVEADLDLCGGSNGIGRA